jgi:hypothetical protein
LAPSRALHDISQVAPLHAAGMSSTRRAIMAKMVPARNV